MNTTFHRIFGVDSKETTTSTRTTTTHQGSVHTRTASPVDNVSKLSRNDRDVSVDFMVL